METIPARHNRRKPLKTVAVALTLIGAAFAVIFLTRTEGTPQREKREPFVPVRVAVAVQKPVPVQLQAIGTVEAFATVSVKSRVDGQLVGVHFREGQDVKKGDIIARLSGEQLQRMLEREKAAESEAKALQAQAEASLEWQKKIFAATLAAKKAELAAATAYLQELEKGSRMEEIAEARLLEVRLEISGREAIEILL